MNIHEFKYILLLLVTFIIVLQIFMVLLFRKYPPREIEVNE